MALILSLDMVMDPAHPKWLVMTMEEATVEEEAVATGVDMEVAITLLEEEDIQGVEVAIEEVVAVVAVLGDLVEVFEVPVEDTKVGQIEEVGSEEGGVVTEGTGDKHKMMHAFLFCKIICNVEPFLLLSFILNSDISVKHSDRCNSII